MKYGFVKVAAATPEVFLADPHQNGRTMAALTRRAAEAGVHVLVFPELSITGATAGDLFFSASLLSGAADALGNFLAATAECDLISMVGLPVSVGNGIYNCAAVCLRGKCIGLLPKCSLTAEESRRFASGSTAPESITLLGEEIPMGIDLLFASSELPALVLAGEFLADTQAMLPPSLDHAASGATLLCSLAASPEGVGRADARRLLAAAHSSRTDAAWILSSAGHGESTTDEVFGGHAIIAENGRILAEKLPFSEGDLLITEVDVERLVADRRRKSSYPVSHELSRRIFFSLPIIETTLTREIPPMPFLPSDPAVREARCEEILRIQAEGLRRRVEAAHVKTLVLGISGGLDSTLALLVATRTMDLLARPRTDILAVTMPCFGTTERTKNNATVLCEELGVSFRTVNIFDAVNLHFRDIGHDPALRDVTYENSQARERTQILMDIANDCGGMVLGTGDLSELALGWATYNGDHMSMYGVNASIPKTLIRHIVAHEASLADARGDAAIAAALRDVLDTPVSPELLPADEKGEIAQRTEDLVGPYELHDFYLYYLLRFGFSPAKLAHLAEYALGDRYDKATVRHWLKVFLRRFFTQQFKRSCLPDGPAVGSVSLSPRGAWQMPSDASAALWLAEAEAL